jgi:hypothetical protein
MRRGGVGLVEGSDAGRLRASDHHGLTRGVPAEVPRGLRRPKSYQRQGIEGAEHFTAAVLGAIPAVARAGVAGEELGMLPGTEAKRWRGLAGSGVRRIGGSTVRQGFCVAEREGGGARVRVAAAG